MEEKTIIKQHRLMLNNRKNGSFTGVLDVLSFDLNEILLETEHCADGRLPVPRKAFFWNWHR